jgi:glycolate oxidase FAD binding subunit
MGAAQVLETIVGAGGVCSWEEIEDRLRSQLSLAVSPDTSIDCIVFPNTQAELAEVLACAAQNQWSILPCGNGSKLHWGGLAQGIQIVVSTARLNRLIEHAIGDLTVTAEAGMRFADLQAILAKEQQFLALDPSFGADATLGGIVATADTGALRQRYGGVREMVIGISLIRADGQLAKAGGRVVKNVAGYDLMKLFTGSWGTLGIISQLTFRIYPLPQASRSLVLTGEAEAIAKAAQTLLASALTPTAIELIAPQTADRLGLAHQFGLVTRFQGIEVSLEQQTVQLLQVGQTLGLQGSVYTAGDDLHLWQQLQEQIDTADMEAPITCKIGVLPAQAVTTLAKISQLIPTLKTGIIHAASGLGMVRFDRPSQPELLSKLLLEIRNLCQAQGGFLTVLEAPSTLKPELDLWGYNGNALHLMQKIKQQFDAQNRLSPYRFLC